MREYLNVRYKSIDPAVLWATKDSFYSVRAPFDYRPLHGSEGIDGIARLYGQPCSGSTQRSPASSGAPMPTIRCVWFRVFFEQNGKCFSARRGKRCIVYLLRRTDERIRIKDKYSWLPAVPGVAFVRSVGSNLMEYTIEEVRHETRVASRFR